MSAQPAAISSTQFALAIQDLPLDTLYSKAAEIENSIAHLERSNKQLQDYSDSIKNDGSIDGETKEEVGDKECLEAIRENQIVVERQRERVGLLKAEVEGRGEIWHMHGPEGGSRTNGVGRARLTDDQLRRQMAERMGGEEEEGDNGNGGGMHL